MLKLKLQASQQGVYSKYLQNDSVVIVKVSPISQSNLAEAQSGLLLDFNIRDSIEEEKRWSGFQHSLKQIFSSVVAIKMIPNCQLKINIFPLMAGFDIESTIINAVFAALLKMAILITTTVCAITQLQSNQPNLNTVNKTNKANTIVVSISDSNSIVYGKCNRNISQSSLQFTSKYRSLLIQTLNQSIKY